MYRRTRTYILYLHNCSKQLNHKPRPKRKRINEVWGPYSVCSMRMWPEAQLNQIAHVPPPNCPSTPPVFHYPFLSCKCNIPKRSTIICPNHHVSKFEFEIFWFLYIEEGGYKTKEWCRCSFFFFFVSLPKAHLIPTLSALSWKNSLGNFSIHRRKRDQPENWLGMHHFGKAWSY